MVRNKPTSIREEVLNVKLAELLSQRGIISVPESIIKLGTKKRLPDIMIGDYYGLRVVLEGKIASESSVRNRLEADCNRRIEEGIASMAVGIIYPASLRHSTWPTIEKELSKCELELKVFSEAGDTDWVTSNIEGLSAILRRVYDQLVREDVVNSAVDKLRECIEFSSMNFSSSLGLGERLHTLLVLPKTQMDDSNGEK